MNRQNIMLSEKSWSQKAHLRNIPEMENHKNRAQEISLYYFL